MTTKTGTFEIRDKFYLNGEPFQIISGGIHYFRTLPEYWEDRLQKLNDMRDKLATKLADPALYEPERSGEAAVWQKKYAEVMDGLDRAEELWILAQERLEAAGG